MGANIARHLKDVGFPVTVVHDAYPQLATTLAKELGAVAAKSLAEVTAAADYIITVVTGADMTVVGNVVTDNIHTVDGVVRTVTCVAVGS